MSSTGLCAVIFLCALTCAAAQGSCGGRCGGEYYRGSTCQCDYDCLSYGECCEDFESLCTTKKSCKGRCGESFRRGRLCSCDADCSKYRQCCSDHALHCGAQVAPVNESKEPSSFYDEDMNGQSFPNDEFTDYEEEEEPEESPESPGGPAADPLDPPTPHPATESPAAVDQNRPDEPEVTTPSETASTGPTETSSTGPTETSTGPTETSSSGPTETSTGPTETSSTILASVLDPTGAPEGTTSSDGTVTTGPPPADLEDPPEGTGPELDAPTTHNPSSTEPARLDTTEEEVTHVTPEPTQPAPPRVQDQPDPYRPAPVRPSLVRPAPVRPAPVRPSSKPQTKPLGAGGYQADDSYDSDLCSGRPVGAVTTLRNGTMVVFRGHYFWLLDQHRVPGPARPITQAWGVPSPIDTAFTRCNCQGKTYIFKGSQYWRFENSVLDGNYPKVIQVGFGGLRGQITAALSVPQFQRRREAVYFFKRGGSVQKYSYQFGTSPTCGRKTQHAVYTRTARHAVSFLQPAVSIRTSWRGFPSSITAAASVPSASTADGYKYYVFSRSQSFSVRMDSGRPAVPKAKNNAAPRSRDFFKCSARA